MKHIKAHNVGFLAEKWNVKPIAEFAQQHQVGKGNTTISTENGTTRVTFHETVVVAFNDKKIVLDSGGWLSTTTKTRMNQASNQFDLGYQVFQQRGEWFVFYKTQTVKFKDGMVLPR